MSGVLTLCGFLRPGAGQDVLVQAKYLLDGRLKNQIFALFMVVLVFASAGAGYLVGSVRSPSSFTSLSSASATVTTSSTITSCTILAPTMGVELRVMVVNSTTSGVSVPQKGARISGQAITYCNSVQQVYPIRPETTNSSGWAVLLDGGLGIYFLTVVFPNSVISVNLSIPTQPTGVTYAVFQSPSGNLTTHFCYYNINCDTA